MQNPDEIPLIPVSRNNPLVQFEHKLQSDQSNSEQQSQRIEKTNPEDYHLLTDETEIERRPNTTENKRSSENKLQNEAQQPTALLSQALKLLNEIGISQQDLRDANISINTLNTFLQKELSAKHYFRWAAIDSLIEKVLQDISISKVDLLAQKPDYNCGCHCDCNCQNITQSLARHLPHGRSVWLQQEWGLKKVYANRSFVKTTDTVATRAVQIFIAVALSYRLVELMRTGAADFSEFRSVFEGNSDRGVQSLVHLLAGFDKGWLQFLLTLPVVLGNLSGLWSALWTDKITPDKIADIETMVKIHSGHHSLRTLLWRDGIRQLLTIPCYDNVTQYLHKAEKLLRWDGRIEPRERAILFQQIMNLALHGRGLTKISALESLAKIVHSLSIKDFAALKASGHSNEALIQSLNIKSQALQTLVTLANEHRYKRTTRLFANYYLWWLGIASIKSHIVFSLYKAGKITLQVLFLKSIIESILQAIDCPDKPGFRMFYGDYEIWANDLTPECFNEFVRQFRVISKEEPLAPFLRELQNFHLDAIDAIDLTDKALTSNETREILQVLNSKMTMRYLNLSNNFIKDTDILIFSETLISLNLESNHFGSFGAQNLKFPETLIELNLYNNQILPAGIKALKIPYNLQILNLGGNSIGAIGIQDLKLSPNLLSLNLRHNLIGSEGARALSLPPNLQSLDLGGNQIGAQGADTLKFPQTLQSLDLSGNALEDAGAQALKLPPNLLSLDLQYNRIGDMGAQTLTLPPNLQTLDLWFNQIGPIGAQGLKLPQNLKELFLGHNNLGSTGAQFLKLPPNLTSLDLDGNELKNAGLLSLNLPQNLLSLGLSKNQINKLGIQSLKLPYNLMSLNLGSNELGDEGIQALILPSTLQFLTLSYNQIGFLGVKNLKFPQNLTYLSIIGNTLEDVAAQVLVLPSKLQTLYLNDNKIGSKGAQGIKLPMNLQTLDIRGNQIGDEGTQELDLPINLLSLSLGDNAIGNKGAINLNLPRNLRTLVLDSNNIGDQGVEALLKKIPGTNLRSIDLDGNLYNTTLLNTARVLQQQILLRRCKDKLCHANTPLQDTDALATLQTSSASRTYTPFFASWIKKPVQALQSIQNAANTAQTVMKTTVQQVFKTASETADSYFSSWFDVAQKKLYETLSDCPSYFPNIDSPVEHDWLPSSMIVQQYDRAIASNHTTWKITHMNNSITSYLPSTNIHR